MNLLKKKGSGLGATEEWVSSADRSHRTRALCRNRENEKIRKQFGNWHVSTREYEKRQPAYDL